MDQTTNHKKNNFDTKKQISLCRITGEHFLMKWSSSNIPYLQCIMCFTFWNVFVATQWAAGVCVFTEVRIIQIVFLHRPTPETPEADHRIVSPSACAKRRRARENILPKWAMREIRAWISLVSSETVHPDRYKCPSRWEGARERLFSVGSFMTLHIHILVPFPSALKQLGYIKQGAWVTMETGWC